MTMRIEDSAADPNGCGTAPGEMPPTGLSRRMVLGSAASVPLLATIPSGAARAMTSTYQCVSGSEYNSDNANIIGPRSAPDTRWVRRRVSSNLFEKGPDVEQGWLLDGTWYRDNGQPFVPQPTVVGDCDPASQWCPLTTPFDSWVLEIYNAPPGNPSGVYALGAWPQYNTQGNGGPAGNFALNLSCLCSAAPDLDPNSPRYYCQ